MSLQDLIAASVKRSTTCSEMSHLIQNGNYTDDELCMAVHNAIDHKLPIDVVNLLLKQIKVLNSTSGVALLRHALEERKIEIFSLLLKYGADAKDRMLYRIALKNEMTEFIFALVLVNSMNNTLMESLNGYCQNDVHPDIIKMLLDAHYKK